MTTPTTHDTPTDRIEDSTQLRAPRSRVWRALTDPAEFGAWFGARFTDAAFVPDTTARGNISSPGYEHVTLELAIVELVPESRFAFRWHPNAIDTSVDYSAEPMTLVTFTLDDTPDGGTLLRIVESGFDAIPAHRREAAWRGNRGGWTSQMKRIATYVDA